MTTMKIGKKFLLLGLLVSVSTQQVMADMPSVGSIITTAVGSAACGAVLFVQPHYEKWLKRGSQEEKDTIAYKAARACDYTLLEKALQHGAELGGRDTVNTLHILLQMGDDVRARALLKAGLDPSKRTCYGENALSGLSDNIFFTRFKKNKNMRELEHNVARFIEAYSMLQKYANRDILFGWDRKRFEDDKTYFCGQAEEFGKSEDKSMCDSYTKLLDNIAEVRKKHGFTS